MKESMLFRSDNISFLITKIDVSSSPRELLPNEQATWAIQYINVFLEDSPHEQNLSKKMTCCTYYLKRYERILELESGGELSQERKEEMIAMLLIDIHKVLEWSFPQQDAELSALYSEIVNKCR